MRIQMWVGLLLVSSVTAFADTQTRVMNITTDAFSGNFAIDCLQDASGAVTGMRYQTPNTPNGLVSLAAARQGPQVLFNKDGHDVLLLSIESDFDPRAGGHANVRFLQNGASGTYKDFRVLIQVQGHIAVSSDPNSDDPDSDNNEYTGVFNTLFLAKNTFFGITVGIDKVVPSEQ
jgi:hypothetical protein